MNKRKALTILIVIGILLLMMFLFMLWLASFVMTGKRQTMEEAMQWQTEHYDTSFYDVLEKEDYTVESFDGYLLHVQLLKQTDSTKYVILSHGYTDNRLGSLKYVKMYLDLGYQSIIYDLRGHGENESTFTTYGIREGQDLAALIRDTRTRYADLTQLGLHGESLGAASTICSLQYQPEVDWVVADCGFSDIENVLRTGYQNAHVPMFLVDVADVGARIRYGYSLKSMRPIEALDNNEIPILFLHGAEDSFILPKNSADMAQRTKGVSELHYIDGAGHAESVLTEPELYAKYVSDFIQRTDRN
jgi:Prolyl oligopeptidase family.